MADTNINTVTSRAAATGDFALVSGSSGVGPARVPLTETGAAALNAASAAALRTAADAASSAQGGKADSALQPGSWLTQAAVNSATLAGAALLSQIVYIGDFSSRPTSGLTAGQMAVFTGTIGGYYWQGLFAWNGAAWRPMHPVTVYAVNPSSAYVGVNTVTTPQTVWSQQFPAGIFTCCRDVGVHILHGKTGTSTVSTVNTRIGSTGTSSDGLFSIAAAISAAGRLMSIDTRMTVMSNTTMQGASNPYGVNATINNAVAVPRLITVPDLTGAVYISTDAALTATGGDAPQVGAVAVTLY